MTYVRNVNFNIDKYIEEEGTNRLHSGSGSDDEEGFGG